MLAILFLVIVAVLELVRRLPLFDAFHALGRSSMRSKALLQRRASEPRKERAMRMLSVRMLGNSLYAGMLLTAAVSPLLLLIAADLWFDFGFLAELANWRSRLILFFMSITYVVVRLRIRNGSRRSASAPHRA
jgi:hypothetical protein